MTSTWPLPYGKAFRMAKQCMPRHTHVGLVVGQAAGEDAGEDRPFALRHVTHAADVGGAPRCPEPLDPSQASDDVGGQAIDERIQGHAPLDVAAAWVHTDGAFAHVVVADHEHVGNLVELGGVNALAQLVELRPAPGRRGTRRPSD